jgi:ABC-type polysaccharide transport system permease subunit
MSACGSGTDVWKAAEVDGDNSWREMFENWPQTFPKVGVLIPSFGEPVAFNDFRVNEGILLVQRERPDTIGARKLMVSFTAILALKIVDVEPLDHYEVMGFHS